MPYCLNVEVDYSRKEKFSVSSYCGSNFGWDYEINVKQYT